MPFITISIDLNSTLKYKTKSVLETKSVEDCRGKTKFLLATLIIVLAEIYF